ncbi:MAG: folate-binding protein [Edaphobacter sp.]
MTPPAQSEIATRSTSGPAAQLAALLQTAAVAQLEQTGWIRVTGEDRVRWLNGMVTNAIQPLNDGEGAYNFFLNAQGRIQGDATVFAELAALLLETASSRIPGLIAFLEHFIIMDDVELADIASTRSGLEVIGPQAPSLLAQIGLNVEGLEPLTTRTIAWNAANITVIHAYSPLVLKFELWTDSETIQRLAGTLRKAGAPPCEPQSLEWLRILEGTPLYGTDIRNTEKARELPQETGQTRALHFNKGCYLGQEIVERIRSRGNVHRTFSGFLLKGDLPASGAPLEADGKPAGELTSVAAIPLGDHGEPIQLALGYVRREALDRGTPIHYPGGVAVPVSLPFSPAAPPTLRAASESERV